MSTTTSRTRKPRPRGRRRLVVIPAPGVHRQPHGSRREINRRKVLFKAEWGVDVASQARKAALRGADDGPCTTGHTGNSVGA